MLHERRAEEAVHRLHVAAASAAAAQQQKIPSGATERAEEDMRPPEAAEQEGVR